MKTIINALLIILVASSLNYSQTLSKEQLEKSKAWALETEAKWMETARILAQEYNNPRLALSKSLSTEQLFSHRERLLKEYREIGLTHGYEMLYNRHVHPSKWSELVRIGAAGKNAYGSLESFAVTSEVVVIGSVRKIMYHPEKSNYYHSSIVVRVDEWLRDDFGLSDEFDEVIIKHVTGPTESGKWISVSVEETYFIGEKLLLFLSRDGYTGDLVRKVNNHSKKDFIPNVFSPMGLGKYVIDGSEIVFIGGARVELNQVRADIREVVRILDVPSFYNN